MHSVTLSFGSDSELEQSTNFLKLAHPLNFTAAVKKSQVRRQALAADPRAVLGWLVALTMLQVHDALCEMLTAVLATLIRKTVG
jgi:hypothetical protein